jgi:transcriptional antiterminator RfaH
MNNGNMQNSLPWYVIQTKSRQEFKALSELNNQLFECFLPTVEKYGRKGDHPNKAVEPLFSRYLFVRFNEKENKWIKIQNTRGVSRILSFGGRFARLSNDCVEEIRVHMQSVQPAGFKRGDPVAITAGPFEGLQGIFQISDGAKRALVLIDILCHARNINLPLNDIRKA